MKKGEVYPAKQYLSTNGFCMTADAVLMAINDGVLKVMLIKRSEFPFEGQWAIPGGFVNGQDDAKRNIKLDEDALAAAKRELEEETGVKDIYLEQLKTYTLKGRDPREGCSDSPVRIWSVAHLALVDSTKLKPVAGSDATDVDWFTLDQIAKMDLAFDHKQIVNDAVERIRNKISYTNVGFELIPKKFTIKEVIDTFEKVLDEKIDRNNFRTKLVSLGVLVKTNETKKEGPGKPAPYYKLNYKKLQSLKRKSLF